MHNEGKSVVAERFIKTLKLVSAIFYQIFVLNQMIALQKLWKMFFISSIPLFYLSATGLEVDPRKIFKLMASSTV